MSIPSAAAETTESPDRPAPSGPPWLAAGVTVLRWLLFGLAAWYFLWPVYRAFPNVEIDTNEGWNAYQADAAFGRMPLYPSPDKLIGNNYPPLSFYIVGAVGRVVGDPILAGRLISLVAVLGIGVAVAAGIRALGGDRAGAGVGGAVFVITIAHYCDGYVGMDDPQLLAQAIMAAGFVGFLRADARGRSCLGPILLMGFAGFVKHNIIAMPATAFLWLGFSRPREAVKCALVSGVAVALGFALCFALYGRDFFTNLFVARKTSWALSLFYLDDLKSVNWALAITILFGCIRWRDRGARLCLLFALLAVGASFLQRAGDGVDVNATFDMIIAVSLGTGLAFSHAGRLPQRRFCNAAMLQCAILLALCYRLQPTDYHGGDASYRVLFDPSLKTETAIREAATAESIAKVRATPGLVMSSTYICYRSGKPFAVDDFNVTERMATGALPPGTLQAHIDKGEITVVESDPRADWGGPVVIAPASPGE